MLHRQRLVLAVLQRLGGPCSRLALMKLCFLVARETASHGGDSFYGFVPYRYGPYSFQLQHELEAMRRDGLVLPVGEHEWAPAPSLPDQWSKLPGPLARDLDRTLAEYGPRPIEAIIDDVYARHPWYASRSERRGAPTVQAPVARPAVYTLGYEGRSVDELLDVALRAGLRRLVDVRFNPVCRRYGFHRSTLTRLCGLVGLEYCHVPALGIPGDLRIDLGTGDNRVQLLDRYERELLPAQPAALAEVGRLLAASPSALLCMELDAADCHRGRLAVAVAEATGLEVRHLGA